MSIFIKLTFLFIALFAVLFLRLLNSLLEVPPIPNLEETYWGPGKPTKDDTSVKPFKINVPSEVLTDLERRLNQTRPFTAPLEGIQQQYGMNTKLLAEIVEFWKTKYDWREREKFLNKFPQYTTVVQGLKIHFIRVKPNVPSGVQTVPLLLLHGWPGSVREFYEIIPLLTTPQKDRDFVFEVIVPSLPGYGFSQGAAKPGLGAAQMAVIFKNLMRQLGFEKFYLQGGDWGALIVSNIATLYPEHVLGVHSNVCVILTPLANLKTMLGSLWPSLVVDKEFEHKMYPLSSIFANTILEMGYAHIQATKPDTIGVVLNESPVGLAAYIIEKFTTWTNSDWKNMEDGGLKLKYSYTDLLDNVMIYWVTGSITTSVRLYSEYMNKAQMSLEMDRIPVTVPSACAKFPQEIVYQSDFIIREKFQQLVQSNNMPDGGHFAAFEVPKLLAEDIWSAVDKFRAIHTKSQ